MMSVPQSLPSFAQAFSSSSLGEISPISNALPPIQSRSAHSPPRKRPREDPPSRAPVDPHDADVTRQSPMSVRIKEEDGDDAHHPPQSPSHHNDLSRDSSATPAVQPLSKKRRVTLSGPPHGPTAPSVEHATPIPISPVVTTFDDDASPRDHSRPILSKQQSKALVDQRRGSVSTAISSAAQAPMVAASLPNRSPPGDQLPTSKLSRIGRISPSTIPTVNRCAGNAVASGSQATTSSAPPITPPLIAAQQPPLPPDSTSKPQPPAASHSLPPPPISFARRRAAQSGGRKKKPADILISPRGAGPSDPLAPVIQSAPPVADPGRFPMAIPRLPLVLNNTQPTRRVATNVPPTPTRFSLQGAATPSISSTVRTMISPPNPSVPIANTLVPPTPHSLHHPGYSGDKSAFLAPFEVFYDALNDSKQLKNWLSEQLQKSNALMMSLKQQQEKMDEMVEDLVEKRTHVMREEIVMLRQRMASLEEALLAVRAEASAREEDAAGYGYAQTQAKSHQNGAGPGPEPASSYRFPALEQRRPDPIIRVSSPEERRPSASPPVEVTRRLSVSAAGARSEPNSQTLHGSYSFSGHNRVASSSQGSAKGTPSTRPQAIPERSSSSRQAESRPAGRMYYTGSYGNGNPALVEGQATSRGGDKT